jgi:hypothetical protein
VPPKEEELLMPENEPVSEADALEQAGEPAEAEDEDLVELPAEVSERDALEQSRPLAGVGVKVPKLRADVPEADALDQQRPVTSGDGDDDDFR